MEVSEDSDDLSEDAEKAGGSFDALTPGELFSKKDYLFLLSEGIERLPDLHRKVFIMWCNGIPNESQDPTIDSISAVLGKTPKTTRKYRREAVITLQKFAKERDTQ